MAELGPNSKRVTLWGQFGGLYAALQQYGGVMPVTIEYYGGHKASLGDRRLQRATFELDVKSFSRTIDRGSDLHQIATETKKIRQAMEKPLRVRLERTPRKPLRDADAAET